MKTLPRILALTTLAISLGLSPASAATIIDATFISTGSRQTLDGAQAGLITNLPGGNWIWGGGYGWAGSPYVTATWDPPSLPTNAANLVEEKTAVGLSLSSSVGYTKPAAFSISTGLRTVTAVNLGGSGAGFWSAMPPRVDGNLSITGFTGIIMKPTAGNGILQLVENGVINGTSVDVGFALSGTTFYNLSYDVDTTTGAFSNVMFNGSSVTGFTSSTAFTNSATAFTGVMSAAAGRTLFNDFVVATAVPEPATWALLLGSGVFVACLRRTRKSN